MFILARLFFLQNNNELIINYVPELDSLYTRHLFHKTYKLYIISLVCECISLLMLCVYYVIYARDGDAWIGLKTIGKAFEAASNLAFILLMLLLSKGYLLFQMYG